MAGSRPVHEASFRFRNNHFLHDWDEYYRAFKIRRSDRPMRDGDGPPWGRIDGRGFTIWVSEICSAGRDIVPPAREIRLESLAPLNPAGQRCWREVCDGIEAFIRATGSERVEESAATDAEPSAAPS